MSCLSLSDASSDHNLKISTIGVVIFNGSQIIKASKEIEYNKNIVIPEALSLLEAILLSVNKNLASVDFFTDSQALYKAVKHSTGKEISELKSITSKIRKEISKIPNSSINLVSRFFVSEAHEISLDLLNKIRDKRYDF